MANEPTIEQLTAERDEANKRADKAEGQYKSLQTKHNRLRVSAPAPVPDARMDALYEAVKSNEQFADQADALQKGDILARVNRAKADMDSRERDFIAHLVDTAEMDSDDPAFDEVETLLRAEDYDSARRKAAEIVLNNRPANENPAARENLSLEKGGESATGAGNKKLTVELLSKMTASERTALAKESPERFRELFN